MYPISLIHLEFLNHLNVLCVDGIYSSVIAVGPVTDLALVVITGQIIFLEHDDLSCNRRSPYRFGNRSPDR